MPLGYSLFEYIDGRWFIYIYRKRRYSQRYALSPEAAAIAGNSRYAMIFDDIEPLRESFNGWRVSPFYTPCRITLTITARRVIAWRCLISYFDGIDFDEGISSSLRDRRRRSQPKLILLLPILILYLELHRYAVLLLSPQLRIYISSTFCHSIKCHASTALFSTASASTRPAQYPHSFTLPAAAQNACHSAATRTPLFTLCSHHFHYYRQIFCC